MLPVEKVIRPELDPRKMLVPSCVSTMELGW